MALLQEVISALCQKAGLAAGQIDVSQVSGTVDGFVVSNRASVRLSLEHLQRAFYLDIVESGGKVCFLPRGRSEAYLMLDDGTASNRVQIRASLTDGSVTFTDAAGYMLVKHSVTALGSGWYLLQLTADVPSGAASLVQTVRLYNASASYAGDGASGIHLWGAQLVAGSVLGDYLATTSAAVIGLIDGSETHQLTSQYQAVQLVSSGSNWLVL